MVSVCLLGNFGVREPAKKLIRLQTISTRPYGLVRSEGCHRKKTRKVGAPGYCRGDIL